MSNSNSKIQQEPSQLKAWIVCMSAALYFLYSLMQMTEFNAIGHELMVTFHVGAKELGFLSSVFFWGGIIFLMPAGLILDRFSVKKVLLIVIAVTTLAIYFFAFAHSFISALVCYFIVGLCGAFAFILPLVLISRWISHHEMAFASGVCISFGFFGAMFSNSILVWLVRKFGWSVAMQYNAALGALLFLIAIFTVVDYPDNIACECNDRPVVTLDFFWFSFCVVVKNIHNWLFGIYTCLVNLPVLVFGAVFGMGYLTSTFGLTTVQAASANVLLFIGASLGSPAFGWLSDIMKSRKIPMYIGAIICLILLFTLMYATFFHVIFIYIIFFMLGFCTSAQIIAYAAIMEVNTEDHIATGLSLGSVINMLGGIMPLPLFGFLLDFRWKVHIAHKFSWFSVTNYRLALWLLPISVFVGIIALIFARETNCQPLA